jgi:4-hydroxybenzoate polyprenyltransferase
VLVGEQEGDGRHAVMIALLFLLGQAAPFGPIYLAGVTAVALLLAYEHWLVRPDDLTRVNQAFFHVNSVISLGLLGVVILDLLLL